MQNELNTNEFHLIVNTCFHLYADLEKEDLLWKITAHVCQIQI